jgi:hypothetical protein
MSIDRRSPAARRLALAATLVASIWAGLMLAAAPAGAVVETVNGTTVGLQPRYEELPLDGGLGAKFANASGNPVVHTNNTYAIYWDPTDHYHGDWQHLINTFLHDVNAESGSLGSVFAVDAQYRDKTNQGAMYQSTFRGAYTDTNKYPAVAGCTDPKPLEAPDAITCLTDKQIQEELETFISTHGLQKGMGTIFYLLTPPGVTVCVDSAASVCSKSAAPSGFCSYHADISPTSPTTGDANTILYAVIPWTAGGLGNYHLTKNDQTPAYDCQDGGFDPSSSPIEKEEIPKVQQEPNQITGTGPDGTYDHALADLIINQVSVEQQNTVTDPLLNAWMDTAKNEATDECRNFFAPSLGGSEGALPNTLTGTLFNQSLNGDNYYLNTAFNLAAYQLPYPGVPCVPGVSLAPEITAPSPVNAGDIVGFDGMESNITLNANTGFVGGVAQQNYATFAWNFGDGSPEVSGYAPGAPVCSAPWLSPCAGSAFHFYQYGGTYNVTLTVTDVGGNKSSATKPITVVGPPPPSQAAAGSAGAGQSTSGQSTQTGAGAASSTATPRIAPNPVATNAIVSRSLASVLRNGLVVRYSVNEQITGRFEVLLNRTLARHLGIGGTPASGLPVGSAPSLVIAKAILVTTKAGRNTVKILFSKRTAARLRGLKKVSLTLRMVVRNASFPTPVSMTLLSVVTLKH